jgi:ParB-like chromosome segregation protein Spo0J
MTWRDLVDDVRRERAEALLARGLTRTEIARRLGFGDARALRAALRRWDLARNSRAVTPANLPGRDRDGKTGEETTSPWKEL